ncbi:MAG: hypothetical protein IPK98_11275 [Chloracidobacterium sp.]|nr:hypothetical protein [Chloracidobacterium sp.]
MTNCKTTSIADRPRQAVYHPSPDLPQGDAPDLANVVNLIGGGVKSRSKRPVGKIDLGRVDVLKRQRIVRPV